MEIKLSKKEIKELVGETNFKNVIADIAREELCDIIKETVQNFFVENELSGEKLRENFTMRAVVQSAIGEIIHPDVRGVFTSMDLRNELRESAEVHTVKMLDKVDIDSRINKVIREVVSDKLLESK